jgi:ankyrin repeat protein
VGFADDEVTLESHLQTLFFLLTHFSTSASRRDFLNKPNLLGETALHRAVIRGSPHTVEFLLKNNADVSKQTKYVPMLHIFCNLFLFSYHLHVLSLLYFRAGATALHYAVRANRVPVAQLLLEHGAVPQEQDADGRSAIDLCHLLPNNSRMIYVLIGGLYGLSDELLYHIFRYFFKPLVYT